jgi:colicin import membrane protein
MQEIITGQIAEYNEFRNQVAELTKTNQATIFDYESDKGEKDARSYVYKLRQSKSAIDKKRKELCEDLIARKKLIDGNAKQLIEAVDTMIDVHMKPLEEKAEREAKRKASIDAAFVELNNFAHVTGNSESIQKAIDDLIVYNMGVFQERREEAENLLSDIKKNLYIALDDVKYREAKEAEYERIRIEQQAELEALRKAQSERNAKDAADKAERERIANEERIAKEAAEKAQKAAESEAQRKIDEANQLRIKAELEAAKAKQDAIDAENERKRQADLAEQKRIQEEQEKIAAQLKREADIEHCKTINNAAVACFVSEGFSYADAKNIITLIAKGVIANITIKY